jgi:mono/diheme cytochrome c family protein
MRLRHAFLCLLPFGAALASPVSAAEAPPAFKFMPQKLSAADRVNVSALYGRTCASCHGTGGQGNGNGLSLFGSKDPLASAAAMHFGRTEPPPLHTVMPAYGAQSLLTPVQIGQLSAYIQSFRPPWP